MAAAATFLAGQGTHGVSFGPSGIISLEGRARHGTVARSGAQNGSPLRRRVKSGAEATGDELLA